MSAVPSRGVGLGLPALRLRCAVGVEQELRLWARGEQVDFRLAIERVVGGIRALDPGDPRARRLPSGVALTADGWEAELASPPFDVTPAGPRTLSALLHHEQCNLLRTARAGQIADAMTGFSTHLNLSVNDDAVSSVARDFAVHCAVPMYAMTAGVDSPGVFVRPRRHRLEIGTEYVEGEDLVAALTLAIGCVDALLHQTARPRRSTMWLSHSREKYGWYVEPPEGLSVSVRQHLAEVWEWSRAYVVDRGLDPGPVDIRLNGRQAECPGRREPEGTGSEQPPTTPVQVSTGPRHLEGVEAETAWTTWANVAWRLRDVRTGRQVFAVMDARHEPEFLARLDAGHYQPLLERELHRHFGRRRLLVHRDIGNAALWHELRPGALVPAERDSSGQVPRVRRRAARHAQFRTEEDPT